MSAGKRAQVRLDRIAKPLRSLGRLEELIVQLADIQGTEDVCISPRCALVFCGDHGVVAEGVSQSGCRAAARAVLRAFPRDERGGADRDEKRTSRRDA